MAPSHAKGTSDTHLADPSQSSGKAQSGGSSHCGERTESGGKDTDPTAIHLQLCPVARQRDTCIWTDGRRPAGVEPTGHFLHAGRLWVRKACPSSPSGVGCSAPGKASKRINSPEGRCHSLCLTPMPRAVSFVCSSVWRHFAGQPRLGSCSNYFPHVPKT